MSSSSCVPTGGDRPNLFVDSGETVRLSPDAQRFSAAYKRLYPASIDEVRTLIGLSDSSTPALKTQKCCDPAGTLPGLASPDDLTSADIAISRRAKEVAIQAASQYVTGTNPGALTQWKPLIDRYLAIGKVAIIYVLLGDIEIANSGTLIVSASTRALFANNIKIHGSGRMVCHGDITINCTTLQGLSVIRPSVVSQVARSI